MNWHRDGWTERDWTRLEETNKDLARVCYEFDQDIGGGGGDFDPDQVREYADRLRAVVARLDDVSKQYV